jgi:uncharacterized membrane protein
MSEANPLIERYLASFAAALERCGVPERAEIVLDVRSHIAEALQYGKPLGDVLKTLGPADGLARAYAVELMMHAPADRRVRVVGRFFSLVGLLAAGSLVTLIVVGMLGSVGVGFIGSGLAIIVIGGLEAAGVHLPYVQMGPLSPFSAILLGFAIAAVGWAASWTLWLYLRFLARAVRRALPRRARASATA